MNIMLSEDEKRFKDSCMKFAKEKLYPLSKKYGETADIPKELVETIVDCLDKKPEIVWDTTKPGGDRKRVMDMSRITGYGFENAISLREGVKDTIKWYNSNKNEIDKRFNVFKQGVKFD